MEKAVVLCKAGQSAYVIITQLTTIVVLGPKELNINITTLYLGTSFVVGNITFQDERW